MRYGHGVASKPGGSHTVVIGADVADTALGPLVEGNGEEGVEGWPAPPAPLVAVLGSFLTRCRSTQRVRKMPTTPALRRARKKGADVVDTALGPLME